MAATVPAFGAPIPRRLPEWIRLFQSLVRERSVFEAEQGVAAIVERRLRSRGVQLYRVTHNKERLKTLPGAQQPFSGLRDRFSLVARIPGNGGGRSLVLNVPLDVVPEGDLDGWKHPPFGAHIEEGRLYGRGAYDDKAGVTIALAVIDLLLERDVALSGDMLVHFVLEDETTGNGTLLCLADGHVADAALIIDGTRSTHAIDRHVGGMGVSLSVRGKPASISVSHVGTNAIEILAELLLHLRGKVFALNAARAEPWKRFPSPYQFITSSIAGESASNTLPENARADVQLTFPPPDGVASMWALLQREVAEFAAARSIDTQEIQRREIGFDPIAGGTPELESALHEVAEELDMPKIDVGPSTGWSDMRHFVANGIPCLLYGPGNGFNPHRANEYYELRDLPRMIDFYHRFVVRWCR